MTTSFRLYCKAPGDKRFGPVDWANGSIVGNLIRATIFTAKEMEQLKRVDLAHPSNSHLTFEFRPVSF
tara:strand:+ start:308 stop:511 length:204 start_codon:yes stop_codon:yes gene_type:complete